MRPIPLLFGAAAIAYAISFCSVFGSAWFNPEVTSDDARQQLFLFHKVLEPALFENDLIYEGMIGYLTPVHYVVGAAFTILSSDAIMAGHLITALQLALSLVFLFLCVRELSSTPAAFLAVVWFLHTRSIFDRMAGGLPRGWTCVILTAFLYFLVKGQHKYVLAALLIGCLTHPPATLIAACTYGLYLLFLFFRHRSKENLLLLRTLLLISPICVLITFAVIKRPDTIGSMITNADTHPGFSRTGRFPFLPFKPIAKELKFFAAEPFFMGDQGFFAKVLPFFFGVLFLVALLSSKGRGLAPLFTYLIVILGLYLLSRQLAFSLYVPDRYIREPLAIFFFISFPTLLWNASGLRRPVLAGVAALVFALIFLGSFYPRKIIPGNFSPDLHAIAADGWLQTGSEVRLPELAYLQGTANLKFDPWRPDGAKETVLRWSVCDSSPREARISFANPKLQVPLTGSCSPRTLKLEPDNTFQVPGDGRKLGVKLSSVELPFPIVSSSYILLIALSSTLVLGSFFAAKVNPLLGATQLLLFGAFIYLGSGSGLQKDTSFGVTPYFRGGMISWLRDNTDADALIAGHPSYLDEVPLFAKRSTYMTTETAHPFYANYFEDVSVRLDKLFRAYFSESLGELLAFLEEEQIDYFVFRHSDFKKEIRYHSPFKELVAKLSKRAREGESAYKQVQEGAPYVVFSDVQSIVISTKKLDLYT